MDLDGWAPLTIGRGTLMAQNHAARGQILSIAAGDVFYVLPGPAGYWVASAFTCEDSPVCAIQARGQPQLVGETVVHYEGELDGDSYPFGLCCRTIWHQQDPGAAQPGMLRPVPDW